jgi:hypothetical protein
MTGYLFCNLPVNAQEMSDSRAGCLLLFETTGPDNQAVYAGVTSDLGGSLIVGILDLAHSPSQETS